MAKRRNENGQMRREDYEAEADDDCRGARAASDAFDVGFQRASEDTLRQRKIVKARIGGAAARAAKPPPAAANPFSGFQGLTNATSAPPTAASAAPPKANPFAGFTGLTADKPANAAAKPATSNAAAAPPAATTATATAAAAATATTTTTTSASYQDAIEVLNKDFMAFVNDQAKRNPGVSWIAAVQEYIKYADEIAAKHALTKPVPINQQQAGKPSFAAASTSSFSFGATPDDKNKTAEPKAPTSAAVSSGFSLGTKSDTTFSSGFSFGAKSDDQKKAETTTATTSAAASSPFSFGAKSDSTKPATGDFSFGAKDESTKPSTSGGFSFGSKTDAASSVGAKSDAPSSGFSFGAKDDAPKPSTSGFSFGSTSDAPKPTTSGFSFGAKDDASKPSTSGFSFGAKDDAPKPTTSGFSFGSLPSASSSGFSFGTSTTGSVASAASAAAGGDDDDDENIGREEATVILKSDSPDDDVVFDVEKAKVFEFKKDEKRWADKGLHPLKVLVNKDTKKARILVRNEIGKIVLNSLLYKGMTVKAHEVKGKKAGVIVSLQVDGAMTQYLLKVTAARVEDFLTVLEKAAADS